MSDNQLTRGQERQSRSMGEESTESESSGRSLSPPPFSLSASPLEGPPDEGRGAILQRQVAESGVIQRVEGACAAEIEGETPEYARVICDLQGLGVNEDEIGASSAIRAVAAWGISQYNTILELLIRINRGGRRLGGPGRLVNAWNNHKDDLGAGRGYPTLFDYGLALNRLSSLSLGVGDYMQAISRSVMPDVRLAGVTVGVHPRAVYLAAAAQVGMDERGRDENAEDHAGGEGHYVPVGGFQPMLRDMQVMLRMLARRPTRRRPAPEFTHGPQALQTMHGELLRMLITLERQEAAHAAGGDTGEHYEPAVSSFFIGISDRIRAYVPASDVANVTDSANELLQLISNGLPGNGEVHHGYGSIDPHGTDHAMGLAVDIFNGRGREGSFQNFGVRSEYWPFVHRLIRESAGTFEHLDPNIAPDAVHELEPDAARELARLLSSDRATALATQFHDRAVAMRRTRRGDVSEEEAARQATETRVRRNTRQMYNGIVNRAHRALRDRIQVFNQLRAGPNRRLFSEGVGGVQDQIVVLYNELRELNGTVGDLSPAQLEERIQALHTRLEAFQTLAMEELTAVAAEANEGLTEQEREIAGMDRRGRRTAMAGMRSGDRRRMTGRLRSIDNSRSRRGTVSGLIGRTYQEGDALAGLVTDISSGRSILSDEELQELNPSGEELRTRGEGREEVMDLDQAFDLNSDEAILSFAGSNAFIRWVEFVRNRPIYDQSTVMVAGFDSVRSASGAERTHDHTHFYGGHHWTIAPREELLATGTGYQNVIYRDMHDRPVGQIERILQIMAESAGGRGVLYGTGTASPDEHFSGGDHDFRQVLERVVGAGEANEMLSRVYSRVVEPYQGGTGEDANLMGMMRDRGFYLLDGEGAGSGIAYAVSEREGTGHEH